MNLSAMRMILLLITCLLATTRLAANGVYRPPVMATEPPTIPMQTAFIRHDDGVQTMLVESIAEVGDGGTFAWILPLPAEPYSIEPADPSSLAVLRARIGPRAITQINFSLLIPFLYLAIYSSVLAHRPWTNLRRKPPLISLLALTYLMVLFTIVFSCLTPNYLSTDSASLAAPNVKILSSESVGSYDVTVLKAADGGELERWLSENGYAALGEYHADALRHYTERDWVFLAMKLQRTEGLPLVPHPLKVVFRSELPVFPMRLTAAPGEKTDVAIFLAGPVPYSHPLFSTDFRRTVAKRDRPYFYGLESDKPVLMIDYRIPFANEEIVSMVNERKWLTRLQGTLGEHQMKGDIYPNALDAEVGPMVRRVYTASVINYRAALAFGLLFFLLLPLASSLIARGKMRRALLITLLLLPGISAAYVYATHDRAGPIRSLPKQDLPSTYYFEDAILALGAGSPTEPQLLRAHLRSRLVKKGNFTEGKGPSQFYFATSRNGREAMRIVLPTGEVLEREIDDLLRESQDRRETGRNIRGE